MGTISLTLPADGETIDASDVNSPLNTLSTLVNGNIDADNLSSGAVTDPKRALGCAFLAFADGTQSALTSATFVQLTFKTEDFDDGNNYDTTSGTFTVPRAGKYHFDWAWQNTGSSTTDATSAIYINGSEKARGSWTTSSSGVRSSNGSVTLKLAASDTVKIYGYAEGTNRTPRAAPYTYFSGAFLGV